MSSGTIWLLIGLLALTTAAIKAAGPISLGGRELPEWSSRVIASMAPALLAALVVTAALADGEKLAIGADTAGVAGAGVALWLRAPVPVAVRPLDELTARALGVGRPGALLARPDGLPAGLWTDDAQAGEELRKATASVSVGGRPRRAEVARAA